MVATQSDTLEMTKHSAAIVPEEDVTLGASGEGSRGQHSLDFNVSFEVGKKKILHNASAELVSGECLAIMGPSGGDIQCNAMYAFHVLSG